MVTLANGLVLLLLVYAGIGLTFALVFVFSGVSRIDPVALGSSWGFRLIIVPGVMVFWPLLLRRWIADDIPPRERNAHRDAAARGHD